MSLFPARMKKIQSKMKALECSHHFSHCQSMGIFFQTVKDSLLRRACSDQAEFRTNPRLYSLKNKDDSNKNEGARVFTPLYIDFSEAQ